MSLLSQVFAAQGIRARFEPTPYQPLQEGAFVERLSNTEAELGLPPLEQPAEPPLEVSDPKPVEPRMSVKGDWYRENLVVKVAPEGGII
jgi:hypothetical protein